MGAVKRPEVSRFTIQMALAANGTGDDAIAKLLTGCAGTAPGAGSRQHRLLDFWTRADPGHMRSLAAQRVGAADGCPALVSLAAPAAPSSRRPPGHTTCARWNRGAPRTRGGRCGWYPICGGGYESRTNLSVRWCNTSTQGGGSHDNS